MNKADRAELDKAIALIDEARGIIEEIGNGEREKFDNLSEGLQAGERGQRFEEVADSLDEVASNLEEAVSAIEDAKG